VRSLRSIAVFFPTLLASGCAEDSPSGGSECRPAELIVATSDGTSSAICAVRHGESPVVFQGADLGGDPSLAISSGRAFLVARSLDTLFELNPICGSPTQKFILPPVANHSGSTNPQDVAAIADGTLFVPRYNTGTLAVLSKEGDLEQEIDLRQFDLDGNPEASAVRTIDVAGVPKVFVALERLQIQTNGFLLPVRESWMLRLDARTRTVEASIPLAGRNPFNSIVEANGIFFLAEPGNFLEVGEPFAGIERFDPAASQTAILVTEQALGGSVSEVAVSGGCGAAIVADASPEKNNTALAFFEASTGRVTVPYSASPIRTDGFQLRGLAFHGSTLYVGDRTRAANGYPIHEFEIDSACAPKQSVDSLFVPQMPISIRAAGF